MSFYDLAEMGLALCAGNCQASRYPPSTCRCPCQGRNHGVLRFHSQPINITPIYQDSYPSERVIPLLPVERLQLTAQSLAQDLDRPTFPNRPLEKIGPSFPAKGDESAKRGRSIGRKIGRSLKHSLVGLSESELNERILKGMKAQFNQDTIDLAIDQAFSVFYSKAPDLPRPELYELYETNLLDKALELMGKRWVIGRPKK